MTILIVLLIFLFCVSLYITMMPFIINMNIKHLKTVKDLLSLCGSRVRPNYFIFLQFGLGLGVSLLLIIYLPLMTVPGFVIAWFMPLVFMRISLIKRRAQFNNQLVDSLTLISSSLQAGFSVLQSIELVSVEVEDPIGFEFRHIVSMVKLGHTIEEALEALEHRMGGEDLNMVRSAISIQMEMGGDLGEIIENICNGIRAREKANGQLKTATSQGKLTGIVIGLIPIGLYFILSIIEPGYFDPLFNTVVGRMFLATAFVLEFIGIFMIYKICRIEV